MILERTTPGRMDGLICGMESCALRQAFRQPLLVMTMFAASFLVLTDALAQPPAVSFTPEDGTPGIQLPFNKNNGFNPFEGDVTINYGRQGIGNFGWIFDTFQGASTTETGGSSLGRYVPTGYFDNENPPSPLPGAAMLENRDWGFHMEFRHRGAYLPAGNNEFLMFTKHAPLDWGGPNDGREDRIFSLRRGANANDWAILVGNNAGGWSTVVTGLQHPMDPLQPTPELYVDFDVHFRSTPKVMDFYWEGALVGSAPTGHGRYDIDFLQFEYREPWGGVQEFRNFRLGHNLGGAPPGPIDGDYNDDGIVDAADYVVWRKNENMAGLPGTVTGDGDDGTSTGTPDGIVDDKDYAFWRSRFGATTPLGPGSGVSGGGVPEPASAVLLVLSTLVLTPSLRRR